MRNRVERLRIWLVGSAIFLVLVIAAFIGMARYVKHRALANLPAKLGIDIKSDSTGFTYSQWDDRRRRTLFTIHAAKQVQYTNGLIALHDVNIVLFGSNGERADRIYGDDFEVDQKAGLVRAKGLVHIDMQAAGKGAAKAEGAKAEKGAAQQDADAGAKVLHVTTSGLVYMEKLGVAATGDYIEFQAGGMTGHATGADYNSDSGMLTLHSAVSMSGIAGGRPATVTASGANFDDDNQEIFLTHAKYDSQGRTAAAEQATLHTRRDGTLERVEAQGNVTVQANGATVVSQKADIALTAASQPQTAVLTGVVRYSADKPVRQVRAQADVATINFDGQKNPQPQHAVFTGVVHMTERVRATDAAKEPWSTRDLTAAKVDALLAPTTGKGKAQPRDAEATGSPRLVIVNNGTLASGGSPAKNGGKGTTEISADDLKAHLIATGDAKTPPQLEMVSGRGHTVLHRMDADGKDDTSTGDTLDAKFKPKAVGNKTSAAEIPGVDALSSAVLQGHVTIVSRTPPKVGKANAHEDVTHEAAERATYDGDLDRMTLSGGVQVTDAGSVLWANEVMLDHKTEDSHAVGGVKVDYVQDDSAKASAGSKQGASQEGPMHILAERADFVHATDVATFHGKPVRLWQGGSQVQAPVIELARGQQVMIARGEAGTASAGQVRTVLASDKSSDKAGTKAAPDGKMPGVVRVTSGGLTYSNTTRRADFTGGFRADTVDATIRASQGTVYLTPVDAQSVNSKNKAGGGGPDVVDAPSLSGKVDRVVATGHIEIDQPGMHATGERLVYTSSDQYFVLTGDANAPPKAVGASGTTTGAALRFHSGDNSVEALGAYPGAVSQPVRTDSQIGDDQRKAKGR